MAGTVTLSRRLFADISPSGISFHRNAFWALPVSGAVPKKWLRAMQWLVWEAGGRMTVDCEPLATANQAPDASLPQYFCDHNFTFIGCVRSLLSSLFPEEFNFRESVNRWLQVLKTTNIKLNRISTDKEVLQNNQVLYEPIMYSIKDPDRTRGRLRPPTINIDASMQLYEKTCRQEEEVEDMLIEKPVFKKAIAKLVDLSDFTPTSFSSFVLIITFNKPIYSVIPYLELLYRPFFPYIVYCGPVPLDDHALRAEYQLNFVVYPSSPVEHNPGAFNYECLGLAKRLFNPRVVEGFLVTSDDLLILVPKLTDAPRELVWFLPEAEVCNK